jgi:hypothetical protein
VKYCIGVKLAPLISMKEHRLRVFENRMFKIVFGPNRDEIIQGWRKLHNEDLHNLNFASSIIRMIKSRRMRLAGHVECMVGEDQCI